MINKDTFYDIKGAASEEEKAKVDHSIAVQETDTPILNVKNTQGEINMAEIDTSMLAGQHGAIRHDIAVESARLGAQLGAEACGIRAGQGDIRREQAVGFGDTRYNIATNAGDIKDTVRFEGQENVMATKDARHAVIAATEGQADRISAQTSSEADRVSDRVMEVRGLIGERFYTVGRDLADLRQGQATLSKDIELNSMKGMLENQKNTQYLADKIAIDGDKTRTLINDLKYHDLNRGLVERNTELVNCEQDRRRLHDRYDDVRFSQNQAQFAGQWAQLQSQIQAFQSQLQETRQGMVNFGTMAGVGQTSTSNNVR
jgi:hypothetical protein